MSAVSVARGRRYLVLEPADEPVSTAEAKQHLRVDGSDEDDLIDAMVTSARQRAEEFTRRAFVTQTWDLKLDEFPPGGEPIELPLPPLQSVTSVKYVDGDGVEQTWASSNYVVDAPSGPTAGFGRIIRAFEASYPITRRQPLAVTVRFVAGYGDAADVPAAIRGALLMDVGHLYANREGVVTGVSASRLPEDVKAMLWPYRMLRL